MIFLYWKVNHLKKKAMATNYPIITDTNITWSKEALEAIEATKTEPCNMIAELVITMEAAIEAVNELKINWYKFYNLQNSMPVNISLNSDLFVNSSENQRKVIEWVL